MNELTILSGQGITALKEGVASLPVNNRNGVLAINLKSLTNSKAYTDYLERVVEHMKECKDCEEVTAEGFGVKLITMTKRVYKESKSTKARAKQIEATKLLLKNLEIDQKADYDKNGFEEEEGSSYYKAI